MAVRDSRPEHTPPTRILGTLLRHSAEFGVTEGSDRPRKVRARFLCIRIVTRGPLRGSKSTTARLTAVTRSAVWAGHETIGHKYVSGRELCVPCAARHRSATGAPLGPVPVSAASSGGS